MSFGVDYKEASEGSGLLPVGEYEVIIKYAGEDTTKGGTVYINVTMVIRNDVEQQYKNKYLWHSLWKRREPTPTDLAVGGYSLKQIQTLSKSAGLENGKKYPTLEEWCVDLKDRTVRVTIGHEEYNGETQARVKYVNSSKSPDCKHIWKKKEDENSDFIEISDNEDDLPF
jgi:hypothetical protein